MKRSRDQLELDVENMGGQLNAYTSRENTSYTMNVFKENLSNGLEILGDMLKNSKYENHTYCPNSRYVVLKSSASSSSNHITNQSKKHDL